MNRLIAVEGINGAGKTCFVNRFSSAHNYEKLYELADQFRGGQDFPPFTYNKEEVYDSDSWFIEQEIKRHEDALKLLERGDVVADRSVVSMLAFAYARRKKYGTDDRMFLRGRLAEVVSKEIDFPWIAYIKPPMGIEQMIERISSREAMPGFSKQSSLKEPYDLIFYSHLSAYYDDLSARLGLRMITVPDASEKSCRTVHEWLRSQKQDWPNISINELIHD